MKVLLSGMGADEIFLGYRRQQALLYTARYQKLPGIIRKPIGYGAGLLPVRINGRGIKSFRWLKRFMSFADLDIEKAYRRSYSYYDDEEYGELFKQDYSAEIEKLNRQHHAYFYEAASADLENRMCFTDLHMFILGLNLTYTDRASMAASVEVRVPFIDREMVNFAMTIPETHSLKNLVVQL